MCVSMTFFRTSVEKLQSKLSSTEASNSTLQERLREEEEEAGKLRHERDELREMTERSSAELRKALEVRVCECIQVSIGSVPASSVWSTCIYIYIYIYISLSSVMYVHVVSLSSGSQ